MPTREPPENADEVSLGDFVRPLILYRRLLLLATLAATVLVAIGVGTYYVMQPTRWIASIGFRPTFAGIELGQYPNKLPFSPGDLIDATILDQVFDRNHIEDFCKREEFRASVAVDETSPELQLLDLDYLGRLSDARLTAVDRQRLQEEYLGRRQTVPHQYRLMFIKSRDCGRIPQTVVSKALNDVLQIWANDSETKRGVLKARVPVLTPEIFNIVGSANGQSLLVHVDLVRSQFTRLIANIQEVEKLPGADLVRRGENRPSLAEVRARLEDLAQAELDPLAAVAGRGLGQESIRWAEQALAVARERNEAAQARADAYRDALREYSGIAPPPSAGIVQEPRSQPDVRPMTTQIDQTFIDKIVELSAANTKFRQEITREMVDASVEGISSATAVRHYEQLLAALKTGSNVSLTPAEVTAHLTALIEEGKRLARDFDELYDEYSRVTLRPSGLMYRVEQPVSTAIVRSFSLQAAAVIIVVTLVLTPIVLSIFSLVHYRLRHARTRPLED